MATHTIGLADASFDGAAEGVNPGDLILITAGSRNELSISNVIGADGNPVWIQNNGGLVDLDADATWCGLYLSNCEYFVLSGRGGPRPYGIKITNFTTSGLFAENTTHRCTVEGIEIGPDNAANGGNGIGWQTLVAQADPFTVEDVVIRRCYIHDVDNEGIYYGNYTSTNTQPFDSVAIYENIFNHCGIESVQFKNGSNADVYRNLILNGGARSGVTTGQSGAGIILVGESGETNAGYQFHHNIIVNCPRGVEIQFFSTGCSIHHNLIKHCDETDSWGGEGVYIATAGDLEIYENTVHDYEDYGVITAVGDGGGGSERLDSNICCSDQVGATHISTAWGNEADNATGSVASMDFEGDYNDTIGSASAAWEAGTGGIHCGWKQATW